MGGVDLLGGEAIGLAQPLGGRPGAIERHVRQDDLREDLTALGDRRERPAHSSRSHDQNPHGRESDANTTHRTSHPCRAHVPQRLRTLAPQPLPAPVCCADPLGPRHPQAVSTGLPSPPSSPPGSAGPDTANPSPAPAAPEEVAAPSRWADSPSFSRREVLLVALAGVLLALLTTWPLAAHMSSRIAPD